MTYRDMKQELHDKYERLKTVFVKTVLVSRIRPKECGRGRVNPDLVKYVGLPKFCENLCLGDIGIRGRDVGQPEWGWVATLGYEYCTDQKVGHISDIFVWDEFRRRGYASGMVRYALEDMKRNGIEKAFITPVHPEGLALVEALEFKHLSGTPRMYYKTLRG